MKLTVIIPNYNTLSLLQKNIPYLIDALSTYKESEIIIIDDYSEKVEQEMLAEYIESLQKRKIHIHLIQNSKNIGFAPTINKAVEYAKGDFLFLHNSDVQVSKNFLDPLFTTIESDDKIFAVGCMDRSVEGKHVVNRGRGILYWHKGFVLHKRGEVDSTDTDWVSGGSSLFKTELFRKFGGFDKLYAPFYWEDIDLSYRAMKSGYIVRFEQKSVVEHKHEEGAIKQYRSESYIKTVAYKNQFIFIWKNITDQNLITSHIVLLPKLLVGALFNRNIQLVAGFLKALAVLLDVLKARNKQKKLYIKSDRDIIS